MTPLDETKAYKKAANMLAAACEKFPTNTQLRFFYGTMQDRLGNPKETINQMTKVIEQDKDHVQALNYLAYTYAELGDNLEAAARVCGANSFTAFRRIMLPLIAPSLITAMLLVFAVATRELVASILVAPVGMQTISIFIWRQFEQGSVGLGMAMAFIAILITTLLPLVLMGLLKRSGLVRI